MAVETKYICDRCKHSQESLVQMWGGSFALAPYGNRAYYDRKVLWCRSCCVELGLIKPSDHLESDKKVTPQEFPSLSAQLEAIMREIVRDEIEANS